jgi:DNA mismatch repair protein MSH5
LTLSHSCAAINGIDASIVSRANEIGLLAARGENLIAACATISAVEIQALETAVCMHNAGETPLMPSE